MNVLVTEIGLPKPVQPREPVSRLRVPCLAVGRCGVANLPVADICEFGDKLGALFRPDKMRGFNPLAGLSKVAFSAAVTSFSVGATACAAGPRIVRSA